MQLIKSRSKLKNVKFVLADIHAKQLSKKELKQLFDRPNLLRIAFLDADNAPIVHPVWYYYGRGKFYFAIDRNGRKVKALSVNPKVYFLVDENPIGSPPLGVRGKGIAKIYEDTKFAARITRRCVQRYLGTTSSRSAKRVLAMASESYAVEVTPKTMATWKF